MVPTTVGWRLVNPTFPAQWTQSLGACAEQVAAELGIGRAEQDAWALRSHELAARGLGQGAARRLRARASAGVTRDESIRADTSLDKLAALAPAFSADGTVTAGNSSPLNDGAIACLVGSARWPASSASRRSPRSWPARPSAVAPERFTVAPVRAVAKALARLGMTVEDVDVWEINEAFAAMVLSTLDGLSALGRIDPRRSTCTAGPSRSVIRWVRRRRGSSSTCAGSCAAAAAGSAWPRRASASARAPRSSYGSTADALATPAPRLESAMTKWEYATVPLLVHATKQILDNWGSDGWELVQVVPGPGRRRAGRRLPQAAER